LSTKPDAVECRSRESPSVYIMHFIEIHTIDKYSSVAVLIIAIATFLTWGEAIAENSSGTARIIDGDSLMLKKIEHRLHGIDAFELDQLCSDKNKNSWRCGQTTMQALQRFVQGKNVSCTWDEVDRYKRALSTCFANGTNINAIMVSNGLALAYTQYSDRYKDLEKDARLNKRGAWNGNFTAPWLHRKNYINNVIPAPNPLIVIKGNINRKGHRYYHCPGDRSYSKTRISEAKGEMWFESVAQAQKFGWIRPPGYAECKVDNQG
jgi:endonuclease YncB( thermonuclease family)